MFDKILFFTIFLVLLGSTISISDCDHTETPKDSKCEGCPPMFNGLPCASTTRYDDLTKGACGCGNEPNPPDFWTKSKFTAAGNAKMMDPDQPELGWCMSNCGLCFELCTTGGTAQGVSPPAGQCIVIQLENRCGDGLGEASNYLCGQEMSPWECLENPSQCQTLRNTNMFGYPAHFDLQNAKGQVLEGLGWDNPEVTFQQVDCAQGDFGNWNEDCFCPPAF